MFDNIKDQHSRALDDILNSRRTVRVFSPDAPVSAKVADVMKNWMGHFADDLEKSCACPA